MGKIYIDNQNVKDILFENQKIKAVYIGLEKVWSAITNLFDKNKLTSYGYTDTTYDVGGIQCIKIYNTTNHGLTFTSGFEAGARYKIYYEARYVASHGYVRVTTTYSDGSSVNSNLDLTANFKAVTINTQANKTVTKIVFGNADNGSGYAYYLNVDSLSIEKI